MKLINENLQKRIQVSVYALLFLCLLLGLSVVLEGCADECDIKRTYVYYEPVYTTVDELRSAVEQTTPRQIEGAGRLYFYNNYIFINQPGEGIHILDNNDPSNPALKSFVTIPGNFDLAIKGNVLYADSYVDLVVLDISDVQAISEIGRVKNVFNNYSYGYYGDLASGNIITGWEEKENVTVQKSECDAEIQAWGGILYEKGIAFTSDATVSPTMAPGTGSGPGVGGSMARFTINQDHLYALDNDSLQAFNITALNNPVAGKSVFLGWDIETIFPYKTNLFIGSRSGMHIVDVSQPASPEKISTYDHVRVCDPVVAQDDLAYVTLRSGSECEGFTNQLEIINIENLRSPELLYTYPMTNPHGLGIDGTSLFICDGQDGLKIFDASDPSKISDNMLAHYPGMNAFDVIPFENLLMMIGTDGLYQYDYSDPNNIKFLSKIAIGNAE